MLLLGVSFRSIFANWILIALRSRSYTSPSPKLKARLKQNWLVYSKAKRIRHLSSD